MQAENIFIRLKKGEIIPSIDPQYHELQEACSVTSNLLIRLNNISNNEERRKLLSCITNSTIDESVILFTPIHINDGKHTRIGKNVMINMNCTLLDLGGITIDDNVLIAPKVSILTEGHPTTIQNRHDLCVAPIHIKKNAWLGAGCTILKGVTIGENAIVAAGAIVSSNVPDNTIVGGTPAKILKNL